MKVLKKMDFCNENYDIYFFVEGHKDEFVVKVNDEKKPKEKNTKSEQKRNEYNNILKENESKILINIEKNENTIENKKIDEEEKELLKKLQFKHPENFVSYLDYQMENDLVNYSNHQITKPSSKNNSEIKSIYTKKKVNNENPSDNVKTVDANNTPYLKKKIIGTENSKLNKDKIKQKFELKQKESISSNNIHSIYRYYDENEIPAYFYKFIDEENNNDNEKVESETTLTTQADTVDLDSVYNDSFENTSKEIFFRRIPFKERSMIMPSEFENLTKNTEFNSITPYKKKKNISEFVKFNENKNKINSVYNKKKIKSEKPSNDIKNEATPHPDGLKTQQKNI